MTRLQIAALFVSVLATSFQNSRSEFTGPRDSLRSATPVLVSVSYSADAGSDKAMRPLGGTQDSIRNRVELRLRRASIPVAIPDDPAERPADTAILRVQAKVVCTPTELVCGAFFDVQLLQKSTLVRGQFPAGLFATWTLSNAVVAGRQRLPDVWLTLEEIIDKFANDWLAANPR